ncbi:MAG: hypothetical protein JRJ00_06530 [Deltaproteobacteria bacterium]|nr:hypothetical protein [Deltaproteobacteria bacterium]
MARKRFTPEQIIRMLSEAEVKLFQGRRLRVSAEAFGKPIRPPTAGAYQ